MFKAVAVIPVYDHEHAVGAVTAGVLAAGLPCILVDDGSRASCAQVLDALASGDARITLVRHAQNAGKGAAVMSGVARAQADGYTHVLQIDADGQHDIGDIARF
ncbi:MAG TPA: glycosyltransferase family 2 protein, partial [Burkholderiaceae bacterium]